MRGLIYIGLILILFSCLARKESKVPYYNKPDFTAIWTSDKHIIDTLHHIRDFQFTNQYGETASSATVKGKIYLSNFFFTTCPNICPMMMENMKEVYAKFKNNPDVMFLSHSVSPRTDSVGRLYEYAKSKDILSKQWQLVRGSKTAVYDIARKSYFVEEYMGFSKDSTEFLHTEKFILIDKKGHIRGYYNGTLRTEPDRIIADINELLKE